MEIDEEEVKVFEVKPGDKITWRSEYHPDSLRTRGIAKTVSDDGLHIWCVFRCPSWNYDDKDYFTSNWDDYHSFTGSRCKIYELEKGWEEGSIFQSSHDNRAFGIDL